MKGRKEEMRKNEKKRRRRKKERKDLKMQFKRIIINNFINKEGHFQSNLNA